jgi:hypothetical protein
VLNNILLVSALILLLIKLGFGARLREIGRILDRLVNILLFLMIAGYVVQLVYLFFNPR